MNTHFRRAATAVVAATLVAGPAHGASEAPTKNCKSVVISPTLQVMLGKSSVIPLAAPVTRIVASGQSAKPSTAAPAGAAAGEADDVASVAELDVLLLSPTDLFLLGKRAGAANIILQDTSGVCYLRDIVVAIDPSTLQAKLHEVMPGETGINVKSAENAIVLTGKVSDTTKLDEASLVAAAYGGGRRVVNLLRVTSPQQVMLEVKIAEVSKSLLDKFGIDFARMFTSADGLTSTVITGIFGGAPALLQKFRRSVAGLDAGRGSTLVGVDAQKKDGLVRILAEPNIMAISGQAASFLSGGRIFVPVQKESANGGSTTTQDEKEFGVKLKFTPTVLDGTRIHLKLLSEVSELVQTGSPFTTVGAVTSVLPSITARQIDTTVQLNDGQSFAVAGLIRNNATETLSRFPGLGELPILGTLFRSTEFQKDQTELIFIITPRLVKPASALPTPTDNHVEPSRADIFLMGKAEGKTDATITATAPAAVK